MAVPILQLQDSHMQMYFGSIFQMSEWIQ